MDKVQKFVKLRLAQREAAPKSFGTASLSLAEIESMFVAKLLEKCKLVERDIMRVFKRFDKDASGYLSTDELTSAIHLYLNGVDRSQVAELVSHYDVDGDGTISLEEFTSFLISRTSQDRSSWQTVDTLIEKCPARLRKHQGKAIDESNFEVTTSKENVLGNGNDGGSQSVTSADAEAIDHPAPQQSTSYRATVFLQKMKAFLVKRAQEVRAEGLIPSHERLGQHTAGLTESIARSIVSKAFLPYMKSSTRVDCASLARVLSKFTHPGSPPPRQDVVQFLFGVCCDGKNDKADPDLLVDMLFDKGGSKVNRWGFAQEVHAATDTRRPAVGKGPFLRRDGDVPVKVTEIPYRVNTPQSRTLLTAPSDFDASDVERSAHPPAYSVERDFVYGLRLDVFSGEPVVYLPESRQEVLYVAAALLVIHDLANGTQAYFSGHTDDISCFSVSNDGALVASGQVGMNPCVMVWETALQAEVVTAGPHSNVEGTPVGLVARIKIARGVCATAFSCDSKFLAAIGCDDKHEMGVWAVASGELLANIPTAPGIPPQIRTLKWSPGRFQDTTFISRDHEKSECDLIVTGGEHNFLRFWSFKRPNKLGIGAELAGRGHSTPKGVGVAPPTTHQCSVFVSHANDEDPVAPQYDVLTAGDNGYVYLWRGAACVRTSQALADGCCIRSMCLADLPGGSGSLLVVGGDGGTVACLDPLTLDVLRGMSVSSAAPKPGLGPPTEAMRRAYVSPTSGNIGSKGGVGGLDISIRAMDGPLRRPSSGMAAPGRRPSGDHPVAGKLTNGRPSSASAAAGGATSTSGIFKQSAAKRVPEKRPQPKDPLKQKTAWKGPALLDEEKPLPAGVKSTPDVRGLAIVGCGGGGGGGGGGAEGLADAADDKYILCVTGFGRLVRLPFPSRSNLRGAGAGPAAEAQTVGYFHFAPLYAVGVAPPRMIMAPTATLFATGGDDCWLCLWNADKRSLIVRAKTPAPIRSLSIHPSGALVAAGLSGGAVTIFACNVSNTAAKSIRSQAKSAAAFQRATDFVFETILTEHCTRRDCREDISDVKFSPNGRMLAVASHDNFIDIYGVAFTQGSLQKLHADITVKYLKRLRGHSSCVLHVDWSTDNRNLQSSCGAHELLFWDVAEGRQRLSSGDCSEGDIEWASESCHLGFNLMGMWGAGNQKGSDINTVDVSRGLGQQRGGAGALLATGDDRGRLCLSNYPCVVKDAPRVSVVAHSSHIMSAKWLESQGRGLLATTGGNDATAVIWRVQQN